MGTNRALVSVLWEAHIVDRNGYAATDIILVGGLKRCFGRV
jgi:hypothetical protein